MENIVCIFDFILVLLFAVLSDLLDLITCVKLASCFGNVMAKQTTVKVKPTANQSLAGKPGIFSGYEKTFQGNQNFTLRNSLVTNLLQKWSFENIWITV